MTAKDTKYFIIKKTVGELFIGVSKEELFWTPNRRKAARFSLNEASEVIKRILVVAPDKKATKRALLVRPASGGYSVARWKVGL